MGTLPTLGLDANQTKCTDLDDYFKSKGVIGYWVHKYDSNNVKYYVFADNDYQWKAVAKAFLNDHNTVNPLIANDKLFWGRIISSSGNYSEFEERFTFTSI